MKKITKERGRRLINRYDVTRGVTQIINPVINPEETKNESDNENSKEYINGNGINDNEIKKVDMSIFNPIEEANKREEIQKWEKITDKDVIFISFFSDPPGSTFYSDRAQFLISSLEKLGYDYCVTHFKNDRNYYQNCCFKPSYIRSKINEFDKNVVWIDGDTFLKRNMDYFTDGSKDFDIGLVTYNNDISGIIASPIFFKNTSLSREMIEKWDMHCTYRVENGLCELDHDALKHKILPEMRQRIRIKLNWDESNNLHNGSILNNVNSEVPHKREILAEMVNVNRHRPFIYEGKDFIII
jgi:hypothetical protein